MFLEEGERGPPPRYDDHFVRVNGEARDLCEGGEDGNDLPLVAVSIDARNVSEDLEKVPEILTELKNTQISTRILFLDANSKTLLRRFNESRRKHPLSTETIGLREAINFESDLLEHISLLASLTIDTSSMSLQTLVRP